MSIESLDWLVAVIATVILMYYIMSEDDEE